MKKPLFILLLITLSAFAFLLIFITTSRLGVNLGDDSVFYIRFANGLLDHNANPETMKILLLRFAPLFPLVLSFLGHLGIDFYQAARWVNALLFAFNIFLAGFVLKRYIGSSWLALCGSLLILASPDMIETHLQAMSEPLFFVFLLSWLLFFREYFKEPKFSTLIWASICVALSCLTRYAGIILVVAGGFGILILSKQTVRRKIGHALIFAVTSCAPLGVFLAWNRHVFGKTSARTLILHPLDFSNWQEIASVFCGWFIPRGWFFKENLFILLIGIVVFFLAGIMLWDQVRKEIKENRRASFFLEFSFILFAFISIYMISVIFAASFLDAKFSTSFKRYFLPLHITGIFLFFGFIRRIFFHELASLLRRDIGRIVLVYLLMFYMINSVPFLIKQYASGDRYAEKSFKNSIIIREVKKISSQIPVYTNDSSSIYVLSGRESNEIPSSMDELNHRMNVSYSSQFSKMQGDILHKKGILVYFKEDYTESGAEGIEAISKKIPLHLVIQDSCGAIYAF